MAVTKKLECYDNRAAIAHKGIKLREQRKDIAEKIEKEFKLSSVASRILAARGFEPNADLKNYLAPTLKNGLPDPRGLKNLKEACALIREVADSDGKIAVCCDFDVDGLSGGAELHHFLRSCGIDSKVFVPDRFTHGYGLNSDMVKEIARDGFSLLITVDYGTTNEKELSEARAAGLKAIVIDHHHVGDHNPPCDVFINPNQKGCGFADATLCAAGLVWYLLVGLSKALPQAKSISVKDYLDLAALGTICDMVPLRGANRVIAKRGLEMLERTARPGLMALKNVAGIQKEVQCSHVSFGIGPRLNAAGRMIHGELVIELLTTEDSRKAEKLARKLNKLNQERQDTEARIKEISVKRVKAGGELPWGIAVWDADFHTGVIGIVAQRLVETFYRPAAVMGADVAGVYKGSVRGIKGFSVIETLEALSEYLIKFGGHEGAGGFSIAADRVLEFAQAFNEECKKRLDDIETEPSAVADTESSLSEINRELVSELQAFAPFGIGNPSPLLLVRNLKVMDVKILKDAHLKVTFSDGSRYICGLMWYKTGHPALLTGARVDVVAKPDTNTFNGITELQLHLHAVERA